METEWVSVIVGACTTSPQLAEATKLNGRLAGGYCTGDSLDIQSSLR